MTTILARLGVVMVLSACLASCGKPQSPAAGVAERFYKARLEADVVGAPDEKQLKVLAPHLGRELRVLLEQARKRQLEDIARAPGDKPAFADGDLFSSLFEGPTSFKVGVDETTGDTHRVSVQLAYDRQQPVVSWTDKVVVKNEDGRPVVVDIEYGGNWDFGNKGTLVSVLKQALVPQVAAAILGNWTVAGHRIPGMSALGGAQAQALHGQRLRFTPEAATSGKDVCPHASYKTRIEAAGPYLAADFRADPLKLGLQSDTKLEITEVACGGVRWGTLGGTLLISPAGRAFAPWGGVFFELQRR
ncbi:MAG TPA: hypothetical protein VHA15_08940 [Burkholderiales bacterium]|jgi:hypothetical protein|nr:hypothetical protein [Burkholderiales bacterium]